MQHAAQEILRARMLRLVEHGLGRTLLDDDAAVDETARGRRRRVAKPISWVTTTMVMPSSASLRITPRAPRRPVPDRAPRSARRTGSPSAASPARARSRRAAAGRRRAAADRRRPFRQGPTCASSVAAALQRLRARLLLHEDRPFDDVLERRAMRKQIEALEHHRHLGADADDRRRVAVDPRALDQ